MKRTLKTDQYSHCRKKHLYAKAGDEVTIVNQNHGHVLVVMDNRGNKFPVLKTELNP